MRFTAAPNLKHPDPSLLFIVEVNADSSNTGAESTLLAICKLIELLLTNCTFLCTKAVLSNEDPTKRDALLKGN